MPNGQFFTSLYEKFDYTLAKCVVRPRDFRVHFNMNLLMIDLEIVRD